MRLDDMKRNKYKNNFVENRRKFNIKFSIFD